ncbi:hypothetical protein Hanom_Chr17g01547281 [Helianthus anomalus]
MIFVIKNMKKITVERMDIVKPRELFDDGRELFVKIRLRKLHFPHVKLTNTIDCIALVNDSRRLPLGSTEYYINKILPRRYFRNFLKIILHHICRSKIKCCKIKNNIP